MKLTLWVGNLDGSREGLVLAPTKTRARAIVGSNRSDFDAYWRVSPRTADPNLEPEVLYTRRYGARDAPWSRGKCP